MLATGRVSATVAVSDLDNAKQFYGTTLGLEQTDENPGGVEYTSGGGRLFVYPSPTAGSGEATCAFFAVDDVAGTVDELKGKGVSFEQYDLPGSTREGDVHVMGPMQAAWFKDPDGNILGIGNDSA
jgi:catechol 2,3-dioxygenase-like lactoylglutathione lyase family enzyme